jgi:hypothetical protein
MAGGAQMVLLVGLIILLPMALGLLLVLAYKYLAQKEKRTRTSQPVPLEADSISKDVNNVGHTPSIIGMIPLPKGPPAKVFTSKGPKGLRSDPLSLSWDQQHNFDR